MHAENFFKEHKIDSNFASGFYTNNFVKPIAIDCTFPNGKSFHPQHIFKSNKNIAISSNSLSLLNRFALED